MNVTQILEVSHTSSPEFLEGSEGYSGPLAPLAPRQLRRFEDTVFLSYAERWLTREDKPDQPFHHPHEAAVQEVIHNDGMVIATGYFKEFFASRNTDVRLESLFIGAAAYAEESLASEALRRVVASKGGPTPEVREKLAKRVSAARENEFFIQAAGEGLIRGMQNKHLGAEDNRYKQQKEVVHLSKLRDRRLKNVIHYTLSDLVPTMSRRPEDSRVVWRPGIHAGAQVN
jgi:hypothetical protein